MLLHVRQCCCALHTFVRIACILLVLAYLVAAFSVILWRSLAPEEAASSAPGIVTFVLVLLFSGVGVVANLLVLVAIRVNRRTLMLPWLVFQLMVVLGKCNERRNNICCHASMGWLDMIPES